MADGPKEKSKLELIITIGLALYFLEQMKNHADFIDKHLPELVLCFVGLLVLERLFK